LRAASLLGPEGGFALLATNTIAQGDTREVGLDVLVASSFSITRAVPSRTWPGAANLEVSVVWVQRRVWLGDFVLDEKRVPAISSQLTVPGRIGGKPRRLAANEGMSFQGSITLGVGFAMVPEEARALLRERKSNKDVLFPYLNGQDLNSGHTQSPSRWVINFKDWPLDRKGAPEDYRGPVAIDYPECLAIVRKLVKPEREKVTYSAHAAEHWWQFERARAELYSAIQGLDRVLACSRHQQFWMISLVVPRVVFSEATVVIALKPPGSLVLLQSAFHEKWVLSYGSTLETRLRYTPTDCFETFPLPESRDRTLAGLAALGDRFDAHRREVMLANEEGLTATYNRLHSPSDESGRIRKLRALHVEMDEAVKQAYGWGDLSLEHAFHQTKQGLRYTISEAARVEVLDRLLELNHVRYAEEVKAGLHEEGSKGKAKLKPAIDTKKKSPAKGKGRTAGQAGLFADENDE